MIAELRPYPVYKQSSLPWIGRLPSHWDTRRLRHACDVRVSNVDKHTKRGETPVRLCNYVDVYKNERIRDSIRFMSATATEDERIRFGLRKEDVLITKDSEDWNDIGVPALVEFEAHDLVCGYHLAILRPRPGLRGAFLHRALECHFVAAQFHVEANGVTRYGMSHGAIRGIYIPVPPPEEQVAIVRFLDWTNGQLDRTIRAKRKVIALLKEQKQAIIHRAVTRGLDARDQLKSSGISWLGDIPLHWRMLRLKSLCQFVTSGSRGWARYYSDSGSIFLRIGNISTTSIDLRLKRITYVIPPLDAEGARTRAAPDDILLSITAQIGAVGIVPKDLGEAFVNQHTALIRLVRGKVLPRWVAYSLLSPFGKNQCQLLTNGGTKVGLTLGDVRSLIVLLPPLEEQAKIIREIERQTQGIDAAIVHLERTIDLVREYRARLVADVITGKLDVREAAARLPAGELVEEDILEEDPDITREDDATEEAV